MINDDEDPGGAYNRLHSELVEMGNLTPEQLNDSYYTPYLRDVLTIIQKEIKPYLKKKKNKNLTSLRLVNSVSSKLERAIRNSSFENKKT